MDCSKIELWLSEYLESSLASEETEHVTTHLKTCPSCSAVISEMRSVLSVCHSYPALEVDPDLIEKILLRTSGRPRTRPFRERFRLFFVRPLLTPRFAVGAILATLFLAIMVNFMVPRISGAASALSPQGLLRLVDRGVSQLYGEGLKAYEAKNAWQEEFGRFRNNAWNSLQSIMEQMDGPVEGRKKPNTSEPPKGNAPKEKSSGVQATTVSPA